MEYKPRIKPEIIGSIIIILSIIPPVLWEIIGGKGVNMLIMIAEIIISITLATMAIMSLKLNYKNQKTLKKIFKYITSIIFTLIAIIITLLWGNCILGTCDGFGEAIISTMLMATLGVISGLWVLYYIISYFITNSQPKSI